MPLQDQGPLEVRQLGRGTVDKTRPHLHVMHVILMDILTSHGGWLCVEKEVPLSELWSYELEGMIDVLGVGGRR